MACCSPELQSALATPRQLVRCINRGRRSALRGRSQAATRFLLQGPPAQQLLAPAGAPPRALLSKLAFWLGVSSGCLPEWRERERKEGENTRRGGGNQREIESSLRSILSLL